MSPGNKKILIGASAVVAAAAVIVAAFLIGRGSSGGSGGQKATFTVSTAPAASGTQTGSPTTTRTVTAAAAQPGPYATQSAAAARVQSLEGGMKILEPAVWRPAATLHVIHATPQGSASYGGDYFFFFVNGYQVGMQSFTAAKSDAPADATTFEVTFFVYRPEDPHCCPSGGTSTVKFHWDGGGLNTIGSLQGASM